MNKEGDQHFYFDVLAFIHLPCEARGGKVYNARGALICEATGGNEMMAKAIAQLLNMGECKAMARHANFLMRENAKNRQEDSSKSSGSCG